MSLRDFDPLVAEWFQQRFDAATEPQTQGWPEIRSGRDVLISAPTGSGKTLAAFLICLDDLIRSARAGALSDQTVAVYVSPLKALSNDIHKNLEAPLAEICELAAKKGLELPRIRTAVRTGDTPAWERQRMLQKPPHILVTTPESLFILLTAEKSRVMLSSARTVIVDEIHAVADDKRGSHLALSLARLERLTRQKASSNGRGNRLQRIGLSATVKPIGEVASFLSETFGTDAEAATGSADDASNGSANRLQRIGLSATPAAAESSKSGTAAKWSWRSKSQRTNSDRSPATKCGKRSTTGWPG